MVMLTLQQKLTINVNGINTRRQISSLNYLPVEPCSSAACQSGPFPEKVPGATAAPVGCPLSLQVKAVSVLQGGGELVEDVQQREEGEQHAQEKCVKVASHFVFRVLCAIGTFLLIFATI